MPIAGKNRQGKPRCRSGGQVAAEVGLEARYGISRSGRICGGTAVQNLLCQLRLMADPKSTNWREAHLTSLPFLVSH
jgi:hypothetical protein